MVSMERYRRRDRATSCLVSELRMGGWGTRHTRCGRDRAYYGFLGKSGMRDAVVVEKCSLRSRYLAYKRHEGGYVTLTTRVSKHV